MNIQIIQLIIYYTTGMFYGILFDFFRSIRCCFKQNNLFVYFEDCTYWIIVGLIFIFENQLINNGEIRMYIFILIIIGILSYYASFSKYILKFFIGIFKLFKNNVKK